MRAESFVFRKVNYQSETELRQIAEIDMTIPPLFDSNFPYNEKLIVDRIDFYKKQLDENDFFELLFDSENQLIGFHIVKLHRDVSHRLAGRIDSLWVRSENRNQGLAKQLKLLAEQWAKSQQVEYFVTWVQSANVQMLEMNKRFGFEITNYKMQKKIN